MAAGAWRADTITRCVEAVALKPEGHMADEKTERATYNRRHGTRRAARMAAAREAFGGLLRSSFDSLSSCCVHEVRSFV